MEQVTAIPAARSDLLATTTIHPRLSWGAIFAGYFVALGMAGLLTMGGLALGLSMEHSQDVQATAREVGIGLAVWMVLIWVGALFVGGMFASWFDGKDDNTMGTMHGVTVWGLFAATAGMMHVMGLGHAMRDGATMGTMDTTGTMAATIAGVMFLCSLLGLLAAALGGWLGANHIHHVYHLRTYARSRPLR